MPSPQLSAEHPCVHVCQRDPELKRNAATLPLRRYLNLLETNEAVAGVYVSACVCVHARVYTHTTHSVTEIGDRIVTQKKIFYYYCTSRMARKREECHFAVSVRPPYFHILKCRSCSAGSNMESRVLADNARHHIVHFCM